MGITYSKNTPYAEGQHWQEIPPEITSPVSYKRYREFVDGVPTGRVRYVYPSLSATAASGYVTEIDLRLYADATSSY